MSKKQRTINVREPSTIEPEVITIKEVNTSKVDESTMTRLLKATFRQPPERIFVGEIGGRDTGESE
ncbi:Flp pilus assembly complex ATPase component TadA [Escherichia coli]|nr:hypothetical protein [Salmonella enterica]EEE7968478.1 hypothetical protein [Salmonella enterica subsp. enterica serovar Enteritidis]EIH2869961.1 Flp pilus assembly complex ATPase component TadA [Escherichia coli]EGX1118896.1 hypothetical protein [Salmonella enterica subsp. enterica serovar Enteritidis]EHA8407596.1 Flp pilus assembly complex ATPase component [Salmonella enterica]